MGRKGTSSTRA